MIHILVNDSLPSMRNWHNLTFTVIYFNLQLYFNFIYLPYIILLFVAQFERN